MEFVSVAKSIKKLMKSRGLTYKNLGKHLGISESGVKKLLNGGDCTYNRLSEIAEFLDTHITDIISLSESSTTSNIKLTDAMQEHFLDEPFCFYVYFCILYDRATVPEIMDCLSLDRSQIYRHLKKLDEARLIQWNSDDKIKVLNEIGLLEGSQTFIHRFKQKFGNLIHREIQSLDVANSSHLVFRYIYCSDQTYKQLSEDIDEAFKQYEINIQRDLRLFGRSPLQPRKHLLYSATGRMFTGRDSDIS